MTSRNPATQGDLRWKIARNCENGACVQVAASREMIIVGSTKNPGGPFLVCSRDDWQNLVSRIKNGAFDAFA
jgi:Domain of unknown function (DUF397)